MRTARFCGSRRYGPRLGDMVPGGCMVPGEVCSWVGYGPEWGMVLGGMALPLVDRMTDACENITFPQLHLHAVITSWHNVAGLLLARVSSKSPLP